MEKKKKAKQKKGLVQAILKGIGLDRLVKETEKTSVFKKRFKEVNKEIEEKLKKKNR